MKNQKVQLKKKHGNEKKRYEEGRNCCRIWQNFSLYLATLSSKVKAEDYQLLFKAARGGHIMSYSSYYFKAQI